MLFKASLLILCVFLSNLVLASPIKDSVGVENNNGKELVLHKIESKETYYSISRKYSVPFKIIMDFNESVALQPGKVIKIPTERPFGKSAQAAIPTGLSETINYKVKAKETLFSIAQQFNTTIDAIRNGNNLKSDGLRIGQVLKIVTSVQPANDPPVVPMQKTVTSPVISAALETKSTSANTDSNSAEIESRQKQNRYGLLEHEERGVGVWIADENLDGSKMLALHRTAPVGTIIKITNPMNGKSTLVKVVGKFTENETTKDVVIVLTKAVADLVGILDKRFQVSIVY